MKKPILTIFKITLFMFVSLNTQAQQREFANLKRYQEANSNIESPAENENRVVFMGNSITDSWPESFFENKPYVNRGISGQTTPQMLIRFRQDVIDLEPKLVVILAGTNDLAGNTGPVTLKMVTNNIKSMCEIAAANNIKVIICSVLPATIFPWRPDVPNPADRIIELNNRLMKYASRKGHLYLDYHSEMMNSEKGLKDEYAGDAVHPNKEGYKVMAKLVEEAISKALR